MCRSSRGSCHFWRGWVCGRQRYPESGGRYSSSSSTPITSTSSSSSSSSSTLASPTPSSCSPASTCFSSIATFASCSPVTEFTCVLLVFCPVRLLSLTSPRTQVSVMPLWPWIHLLYTLLSVPLVLSLLACILISKPYHIRSSRAQVQPDKHHVC